MSDSFATPWAVARQAPVPMGFPRQVYWSGLSFQGNLPGPGVKPVSSALGGVFFFFFLKPLSHQRGLHLSLPTMD